MSLDKINNHLFNYLNIGGLPKIVETWIKYQNQQSVDSLMKDIVSNYESDIKKYYKDSNKVIEIFKSIPNNFYKKNCKFTYSSINSKSPSKNYKDCLQQLVDVKLIYQSFNCKNIGLPLIGFNNFDCFKTYLFDVGILRYISSLDFDFLKSNNSQLLYFKNQYLNNFILTSLIEQFGIDNIPSYWKINNPNYGVDFVIQYQNLIIPIEVKSSTNTRSSSLKYYTNKFNNITKLKVRFSTNNLKLDGNTLNIPLCLADFAKKFIDLAIDKLKLV